MLSKIEKGRKRMVVFTDILSNKHSNQGLENDGVKPMLAKKSCFVLRGSTIARLQFRFFAGSSREILVQRKTPGDRHQWNAD